LRAAGSPRRFLLAVPFKVAQDDGLPEPIRQAGQGTVEFLPQLLVFQGALLSAHPGEQGVEPGHDLFARLAPPPGTAQLVDRRPCQAVQAADQRTADDLRPLGQDQENGLGRIFRVVYVPDQAQARPQDHGPVPADHLVKCFRSAGAAVTAEEFFVGHRG
jgi:hypothetical protein